MQIKSEQSIENRIVYGRLLPYSHSSNRWYASDDDNFQSFGQVQAQVVRLNLYVNSTHCAALLRQLSAGQTISAISNELKLKLTKQLSARFGATALPADELAYRPAAYLLNRDAYDRHSLSSPHGGGGAISASITQIDKDALFRLGQDYDVALTKLIVEHIDADTGLDFGGADIARFGDIELLVFPALDEQERRLLNVTWTNAPLTLVARFNPMQVPHFSGFQFRLSIANDGQIVYSSIAKAARVEKGVFECKFELSSHIRARTDSTELEVFGFDDGHSREGTLCCRWRVGYIREINLQGNVVGGGSSPVKFDWLEKTIRPSASGRMNAALTMNRSNLEFTNRVGGREADPWVPVNRDLSSLFARLHPPKSEGRFFQRWVQGDGEGRLQFVEWFKALLAKHQQHQIVIFDPYFEDAGLGLVLLCAAPNADYIVFTSLSKPSAEGEATPSRINNLVTSCELNSHLLRHIKLRIYGMKEGRLHDRYILIMGPDGLPAAGFNLSNSFQSAAQNYPLLITPIPADTLLEVEQYKFELVREAEAAQTGGGTENPSMQLLFDSSTSPTEPRLYEPLRFLDKDQAGRVLSAWTNEPSLQGLSGDGLKAQMGSLGLLRDDSHMLLDTAGLQNCLDQQAGDFTNFTPIWEMLGEVLAHSYTGSERFHGVESEHGFLEFLARYLESSFERVHDEVNKELAVVDAKLLRKPVENLLRSTYHSEQLFHAIKYAALTWPEYYTIKLLWWYAPNSLLSIAEAQIANLSEEPQIRDAVRLSLLSQIFSEIALSVQFDIGEEQRDRLVCSENGLLQWLGLNAIERQLEKPDGLAIVLSLVAAFPYPDQVRALGWMVHRTAKNSEKAERYKGLVAALHEALPATISAAELTRLVDSMRGHMQQLAWAEPWLFQDVIFPLLQDGRANTDDACHIWIQELACMLEPEQKDGPQLFDRTREGQTTNIIAFLFAHSSPEGQQASLGSIWEILKRQQRIVRQPLASTSNWTRWNDALVISMWILTFTRWAQYYMREQNMTDGNLAELSRDARELALVRPIDEWREQFNGKQGELAAFLDQVDELLAASREPNS